MTRFGLHTILAGLLFFAATPPGLGVDAPVGAPDFQEVYQLIRTHASGVSDADLNRAAIQGILTALGTKVSFVNEAGRDSERSETPLLTRIEVFAGDLAYLRVGRVAGGLSVALSNTFQQVNATNKVAGLVLDLRYADGENYGEAAAAADLFFSNSRPLLDWGAGVVSSRPKANAIQLPVAILVNSGTSGAAEALAAVLRANGTGLILGGSTAGAAMVAREFPLKNGDRIRIATGPVTVGDGTKLPTGGIKPDIDVLVSAEAERAYFADAFYVLPRTNLLAAADAGRTNGSTATSRRVRLNEAELVREHREGLTRQTNDTPQLREPDPETPIVSDPALARALDLLKGLAVVRQSRS